MFLKLKTDKEHFIQTKTFRYVKKNFDWINISNVYFENYKKLVIN